MRTQQLLGARCPVSVLVLTCSVGCCERSGDTLGIETILNQHHEYRFSLKAVTHCRVLTVPRNDVSALFGADPDASKSARKLSLMRLPSDESILRRASRSLNW